MDCALGPGPENSIPGPRTRVLTEPALELPPAALPSAISCSLSSPWSGMTGQGCSFCGAVDTAQIRIWVPLLTRCVTLGKALNQPELRCLACRIDSCENQPEKRLKHQSRACPQMLSTGPFPSRKVRV